MDISENSISIQQILLLLYLRTYIFTLALHFAQIGTFIICNILIIKCLIKSIIDWILAYFAQMP